MEGRRRVPLSRTRVVNYHDPLPTRPQATLREVDLGGDRLVGWLCVRELFWSIFVYINMLYLSSKVG